MEKDTKSKTDTHNTKVHRETPSASSKKKDSEMIPSSKQTSQVKNFFHTMPIRNVKQQFSQ